MLKIVITGPESSGKSTLAAQLSRFLRFDLLEEQARVYLERYGPEYAYSDIRKMAEAQFIMELEMESPGRDFICDTDLLNYEVWYAFKYGTDEKYLSEFIAKVKQSDLYLLCYPDMPWENDPLRENAKERYDIYIKHEKLLTRKGLNYKVIRGQPHVRINHAITEILKLKDI